MPYRILCNGVKWEGAKPSPDLAPGLLCYVPLHKIRYGIRLSATAVNLNTKSVNLNAAALDLTVNQNIMSHTLDVDKLFVDYPDLRPYFFEFTPITPSNKDYNRALAIADYQLDFFDVFLSQVYYSQSFLSDPQSGDAWDNYMGISFLQSPIMCHELKVASIEQTYTAGVIKKFEGYCPNEKFST